MLMLLKSLTNWLFIKRSCTGIDLKKLWDLVKKQQLFVTFCLWVSYRKVRDNYLTNIYIENFNVALELLRKAETLTDEGDKYRAVTYNNFACIFRRTKKLRSALSYLEKALEIEYNYLHYSADSVDNCLQVLNPTDIHLNICAILSQMGKHELAL
jgi:tetratricopeptide (TPR) repeat protein